MNNGLEKQKIREILERKLSKDLSYDSGYILGSMCTDAHEFGQEIYAKYVSKNLGDPGLFLGTAELEEEVVEEIGELFNGKKIGGSFTTGGSEANLIAMRIAKKLKPNIDRPEIVLPISAHRSFDKAADLLGIKLRKAKLNDDYSLDLEHFESLINKNTCGAVGIAGTTSLGLVDPIEDIGNMIRDRDLFFHVDAAFGGFVLPFLKESQLKIKNWDFSVKEVNSITADPHKMGMGVIPSGGIFIRESETIIQKAGFEIPYLAGGNFKHLHIVGTRPGGTVIAFWALMKYLGFSGFKKIIDDCMKNTRYIAQKIEDIDGIKLATEPVMNVVGITTENGESICELDEELRKFNWMLGKFLKFNLIRIVIMPHVRKEHLQKFSADLCTVVERLKLK
ncbi:MAG: tyrosine decarboxylase MfnA [Candidatus Lokiarchaeota archaeon]|nr:tyrosine decarboxylase MfnA [Candidatus Lokiarchaeota archaeon]MBD3198876.1 tyrosine decarboxylase MfnA [Candidatus Lokiarchaeota archaeon]